MVGFEKVLGAVKVIKDQIQYRSQSLLNLARGYFTNIREFMPDLSNLIQQSFGTYFGTVDRLFKLSKHVIGLSRCKELL